MARQNEAVDESTLRGLTTVSFFADDVEAAKEWYTDVLGIEPYYERPSEGPPEYVEFRLGDNQHELGVIDRRYAPEGSETGPGGAITYWHVDDLETTYETLLSKGASEYQAPRERGEGFVTASVVDPFENVLGIMYNSHYLEMLEAGA